MMALNELGAFRRVGAELVLKGPCLKRPNSSKTEHFPIGIDDTRSTTIAPRRSSAARDIVAAPQATVWSPRDNPCRNLEAGNGGQIAIDTGSNRRISTFSVDGSVVQPAA